MSNYRDLISYAAQQVDEGHSCWHMDDAMLNLLCFLLTREGVPTGFRFVQTENRVYSEEVEREFPNISIIGASVGVSEFSEQELKIAERCIDLLKRIKSTEYADITTAILFSCDRLNEQHIPTEKEVFDDVISWNPAWNGIKEIIILCIQGLSELGWVTADWRYDGFDLRLDTF